MQNTMVTDTNSGNTPVRLASCQYTRTGYTFVGWEVDGTIYQAGTFIPIGGNVNVIANAQWSENTLTVNVNDVSGYSEETCYSQIIATVSTGGTLSYAIISVTGGEATVNAQGLVTYVAPYVSDLQIYDITVSVTATFPSTETITRTAIFSASIEPIPPEVIINEGTAEIDAHETTNGYLIKDISYDDLDVTIFIGPQYTDTDIGNVMDDSPSVRALVGIIPLLLLMGLVTYLARNVRVSKR